MSDPGSLGRAARSPLSDTSWTPAEFFLAFNDDPDSFAQRNALPVVEDSRYVAFWYGLPLRAGCSDPNGAMQAILDDSRSRPIEDCFDALDGIYALAFFSKSECCWYIVGDAAGMLRLFYDRRSAGTSFLGLLARGGYGEAAVDRLRLIEFILHEAIFGPWTPVGEVQVLAPESILRLGASGAELRARRRPWPRAIDLTHYFPGHAPSLLTRRISVDLTGGGDSRLVFALASRALANLECCVIGDPSSPDVRIASEIARRAGIPAIVRRHELDTLEAELWPVFRAGDGITDLAHFHPNWQNLRDRRARGIDLILHGGGGELFRDAYCLQDFPLYDLIPPRLERFYDWRLCPLAGAAASWLASPSTIAEIRTQSLAAMRPLASGTNCTSYDRIWLTLKAPSLYGQFYSNYLRMGCAVLAPFLEWRNVAWAICQPGRNKAMHQLHRRLLTEQAAELARVPTTEGYRLAAGPLAMSRDLLAYFGLWTRKLGRKAAQRLIGRTWFLQGSSALAEARGFADRLRESPELPRALAALARIGVARVDAQPKDVPSTQLGRVLTAGMLVQFLAGRH